MADLGTALTLIGIIIIIFSIYRSIRKKNFKKHIILLVIGVVVLIAGGIVTPTTDTASSKKEPIEAPKKETPKMEVSKTTETKNTSKSESKPVVSKVKNETKKEAVSKPKLDKPKKKATENLSDEIKKSADPHFGKITDFEVNDDMGKMDGGKIVLIHIRQDSLTKRTADYNTTNALARVFKIGKVNEITYFWEATLTDTNGNNSVDVVDKIQMNKKTASTIKWDNFLYTNLDQVADSYNASPVLQ